MKWLVAAFLLISSQGAWFFPVEKAASTSVKDTIGLQVLFHHKVGDSDLHLMENHVNSHGEVFIIRNFRYYISNIRLQDERGQYHRVSSEQFLVNEADPDSKRIQLPVEKRDYKKVRFLLGVDTSYNHRGVQTGVLDPVQGMFWTWNSGYIFAKLEGRSEASRAPANYFTYHIGGYKMGENALQEIELDLNNDHSQKTLIIQITADVNKWFRGRHEIKISEYPVCHSPGELAVEIAENYAGMFSVQKVER